MNETKTVWRDCADPEELAAAVAAGVEVRWAKPGWSSGEWALSTASSPPSFAGAMRRGNRYSVPALWSWRPEPPAPDEVVAPDDDRTTRRRRPTRRARQRGPRPGGGCDGTSNGPTRKEAAMNETKTEWRDCADPDELAAAVAAGVEVRWAKPGWSSGEWALSTASSPANFAGAMRRGNRYSVPTSWTWSPEPPATGAERYLAGRMADPEYRAAYEATSPPAPDDLRERLRLGIEDAVNDYADVVMDIMDAEVVRHAGWLAARLEEADAERTTLRHRLVETAPTPPPAPPWPGAVLSGLVDEDGVPTWLAQAGQVRGDQGRGDGAGSEVVRDTSYGEGEWVEVRAPRAVPEPETERVPWWEANDRELVDGLLCVENAMIREVGREGDRVYVCGYEDPDNPDEDDRGDWQRNYWFGRDGFDGTVEVRKDGDQ